MLTVSRRAVICSGNTAAGLAMTGVTSSPSSTTPTFVSTSEKFNGSTWSITASVPTTLGRSTAAGTQSDTTICGGTNGTTDYSSTYNFNGTAFVTRNNMLIARNLAQASTGGSSSSLLVAGGAQNYASPSLLSSTEEYST
jgi:hypothetical protein